MVVSWREATSGTGFLHQGKIKGWRFSADQLEVWYRVQNSALGRSEIENLLCWAFGIPESDPLEPDTLVWSRHNMSARIHAQDAVTGAIVVGHGSGDPQSFPDFDLVMNFGPGETIH